MMNSSAEHARFAGVVGGVLSCLLLGLSFLPAQGADTKNDFSKLAPIPDAEAVQGAQPDSPIVGLLRENRYLIFSAGYKASKGSDISDYLRLGYYDFYDIERRRARVRYLLYDSKPNRPPWRTNLSHPPMNAPYGGNCRNGPIYVPAYAKGVMLDATWSVEGSLLKVRIGEAVHEWALESVPQKYFKLNGPYRHFSTGSNTIAGTDFGWAVGFGYLGREVISDRISLADFLPRYRGDQWQNNHWSGSAAWDLTHPSFSKSYFTQQESRTPTYPRECSDARQKNLFVMNPVTKKRDMPMWCQTTMLFNYAPMTNQIVYSHGGHDYNGNGCFDEENHTLQMFAVMEDSKVGKLVWVEHFRQSRGYPIVSVGRYYQD